MAPASVRSRRPRRTAREITVLILLSFARPDCIRASPAAVSLPGKAFAKALRREAEMMHRCPDASLDSPTGIASWAGVRAGTPPGWR